MAQNENILTRLGKLFQSNIIVRKTDDGQLKVKDVNFGQQTSLVNNFVDRYNRLIQGNPKQMGWAGKENQRNAYEVARNQLFRDYELMDADPIISSALDIYSDECVGPDTIIPLLNGERVSIKELYDRNETDFWVYSLDINTGNFIPAKCEKVANNGKKMMYKLTLDDGTIIEATGKHLWVSPDGTLTKTSDLVVGSKIKALDTKISNKKLGGYEMIKHNGKFEFLHRLVAKFTPSLVEQRKTTELRGVLRKNGYNNFTEFVNSNNHIISKIEKIGMVNSYDLVNVGENHIYAIESNDGAKIYCHNSTIDNVEGQILKIKTDNVKVHDILHNLFYDIINIEFNLWSWMRNLTKYGDFFLSLDIVDKYGIVNVKPLSSYGVFRLENHEPSNPKLVQFEIEEGGNKEVKENYEVAHFRLVSDSNFLPYGKSMLEGARRVFKQLTLMEDAMLIHRIMRAPEKRIFKVDIGNIPPNEVENFMNKVINKMKKIPVIDQTTGDYNLRYNIESTTEDYYLPVRGSDSGTSIETLQGLTNDGAIDDIEYLKNKMMAALKIPKAFLGYEEGVGCVVPETEIPLLNGEIKTVKEIIEDYENGIKHYTYAIDLETNMIVPGEIEWAGYTKKDAKLVRVNLDNDKYIDCTPDHRFLTRDGEWVEAQDLQENQSLMPLYLDETNQKNKQGYTTVYQPGAGKYEEVHRLVAEHYGMVEAGSGFVVHHIDFNKINNYPENFDCSMNFMEHKIYHSKLTEKTLNSPENIAKRVEVQKKNDHFKKAGRKGGLKSADKLVKWLRKNGPRNKGRIVDLVCKQCGDTFTVHLYRKDTVCCSMKCRSKLQSRTMVGNTYNTKYTKISYDELVDIASTCKSFKEIEHKLGDIDRNTLNRIFEYNNINKVDFIFNHMPLALKNKGFMQNYRKYEKQYLNHKVVSVECLVETKDTCDLTITKYHNFATNAGVIIHNSKATLAAEDVRFARTIERLQKIVVAELSKIAIIHLYSQGFEDAELINFDLELQNPSMIHEQEKLELLSQQVDIANSLIENKLLSRDWIYDNIFEFNKHEKEEVFEGVIEDRKQMFRFEQIETEGNDPAESGEKAGDGDDLEMARRGEWGGDRRSGTGEKEYGNEYDADDIKDATKYERERYGKREFKKGSPLAPGKGATIVKSESFLNQLKQRFNKNTKDKSILSEENIIEEETSE